MTHCLYLHINPAKKEVFYVGIGNSTRPYSIKNRSKYWHNTVNRYGLEIVVLYKKLDFKTACSLEIEHIKIFGRKDLVNGTLVNMTNGGEGFKGKHSVESKKKMSIAHIGIKHTEETILKMIKNKLNNPPMLGKSHSKISKQKMSISHKGVKKSMETRNRMSSSRIGKRLKQVIQYDISGNYIKTWNSIKEIREKFNIFHTGVSQCCHGKAKTSLGFIWKFENKNS